MESALRPIHEYACDLRDILFRPTRFFRRMPITGGYAVPLIFALVIHWISSALRFSSSAILGNNEAAWQALRSLSGKFVDDHLETTLTIWRWAFGASSVFLDPFITIISLFYSSCLIWVGAKLLVPTRTAGHIAQTHVQFEIVLRILCYASAISLISAFPWGGTFFAWIWGSFTIYVGVREVLNVRPLRAAVITMFPSLLISALVLLGGLVLGMIFFKAFWGK